MKKRIVRSAIPIYLCALSWILYGMFLPLYRTGDILLCAGISIIVKLLASRLFPGRVIEEEEQPNSGDDAVNQQILEGRANLKSLKTTAEGLNDPQIAAQLERMISAGDKIFQALEKNPRDSQQVRKFMNYYLPTTLKLLNTYQRLAAQSVKGENITSTMFNIAGMMHTVADAFEKQLDSLFTDEAMDVSADISVFETLLKQEGFVEDKPTTEKTERN